MRAAAFIWLCFTAGLIAAANAASGQTPPFWWETAQKEAGENGYTLLSPEEFDAFLQENPACLLVDVRPDYEYEDGHIPGAVNLMFDPGDRMQLAPEKQQRFERLLGPDKSRCIVIYCRDFR